MKRLLSLALLGVLAAASVSAQSVVHTGQSLERAPGMRPNTTSRKTAPPVTNPEPMTLVALAGGAAVAGGLLRRRKQAK